MYTVQYSFGVCCTYTPPCCWAFLNLFCVFLHLILSILGISAPATPSFQVFLYLRLRHFSYFCTCYSVILGISAPATPAFQLFLLLLLRHFRYFCTCYSVILGIAAPATPYFGCSASTSLLFCLFRNRSSIPLSIFHLLLHSFEYSTTTALYYILILVQVVG